MRRRPIPPLAWLLAGGTAVALAALAFPILHAHGTAWFFREGDGSYYRATALDPFGTGHAFVVAGRASEVPYRYGRIGLPFASWVFALGRPGLVPWSLILVHLAAIAAIPGLAAVLADDYGAPPVVGAVALLSPIVFIRGNVYAEPLLIALLLLAFILEARGRHRSALVVLACSILVKETAILALIPWGWRALRRRDFKEIGVYAGTLVPYAAWCIVIRVRDGAFPFLAHTLSRTQAISPPGVGIHQILVLKSPNYVAVIIIVAFTIAVCCIGAFLARRLPIAGFTLALAALTACLGQNALRYSEETFRLLTVPQVFGFLCVAVALTTRRTATPPRAALASSRGSRPAGAPPLRSAGREPRRASRP